MRIFVSFSILVLAFTGCTSVEYQQMQNERDTRREVYEDTRRKEASERSRNFLSDEMIGKWEFLDIVIEERGGSEDLLKAKAALTASRLKGFRLRFWKGDDTSYYYRIENLITKSYGKYTTGRHYKEDEPKSGVLRLFPIAGRQIPDLFFDFTKGVHQQVLASDGRGPFFHRNWDESDRAFRKTVAAGFDIRPWYGIKPRGLVAPRGKSAVHFNGLSSLCQWTEL